MSEPTIGDLRRELVDVRKKVGELERRIEEMAEDHRDLDVRVDLQGETIERIETAVSEVQSAVLAVTGRVDVFISKLTKESLLTDRKDRKINAVLMALITKWELPVDLTALDEASA